jgi:hypothetical protein
MIDIPLEDLVFVACAAAGGGLLLVALLAGDRIGVMAGTGVGGVSLPGLLLVFVAAFGTGGLFATHLLDAHGVQAALAAAGTGVVGIGLLLSLLGPRRRAED